MDETTQVLVATLSGFIIAFFAEPVKNYFANKANKEKINIALHKELFFNYANLFFNYRDMMKGGDKAPKREELKFFLQNECYKDVVANNIALFYELEECMSMGFLYSMLGYLISLIEDEENYSAPLFITTSKDFMGRIEAYLFTNRLNSTIVKSFCSRSAYQEILNRGEQYLQKNPSA